MSFKINRFQINILSGPFTIFINLIFTIVSYPIYLKYLGYELYGSWLVLATVISFSQIGNLGIGSTIIKFTSEFRNKDIIKVSQYIATSNVMLITTGIVIFLVVLLFKSNMVGLFNLSSKNEIVVSGLIPFVCILSIFLFVVQIGESTLAGLDRIDLANVIKVCGRAVAIGMNVGLLVYGVGIEALLIGNVFGTIVQYIFTLICIKRIDKNISLSLFNCRIKRIRELLDHGLPLFYTSLINLTILPFNKFLIVRYISVESLPIFEIAYNASMQIRRFFEVGLKAILPEISSIIGGGENYRNKINMLKNNILYFLGLSLIAYTLAYVLSPTFLPLWLKDSFNPNVLKLFKILLVGTFISLLGVPSYYYFVAVSLTKRVFYSQLLFSIAGLISSVYLILSHSYTVVNVGYVFLGSFIVSTVYLNFVVSRYVRSVK